MEGRRYVLPSDGAANGKGERRRRPDRREATTTEVEEPEQRRLHNDGKRYKKGRNYITITLQRQTLRRNKVLHFPTFCDSNTFKKAPQETCDTMFDPYEVLRNMRQSNSNIKLRKKKKITFLLKITEEGKEKPQLSRFFMNALKRSNMNERVLLPLFCSKKIYINEQVK